MTRRIRQLLWQIPLTLLACVVGSLVIVWALSGAMGVPMNVSSVTVLSAALGAAAIVFELRGKKGNYTRD